MPDGSATGIDFNPYRNPVNGNALTGDLDATFTPVEDDQVLIWDVLKTLTTPTGALFWAPTKTVSIPDELNNATSEDQRARLKARAEACFDDEPRMDVAVDLTYSRRTQKLAAIITVTSAATGQRYVATIESDGTLTLGEVA